MFRWRVCDDAQLTTHELRRSNVPVCTPHLHITASENICIEFRGIVSSANNKFL